METRNVVKFHGLRQIKDNFHRSFQRKMQVTRGLVKRLSLEKELVGHSGCVNCLQWNDTGDLLASGSDDLNIVVWSPFLHTDKNRLHIISSGHHGNIFSVRFVPGTNDHCVVSGAADFKIRVNNYTTDEVTFSCCCHGGRVKRIATSPSIPKMFWSAAEDGMVIQYDLRAPHQCSNICNNVLINLVNYLGRTAEAKCIAVNPIKPELIAVGANDPYIRMYDRRMIKTTYARFSNDATPSVPWDLTFSMGEPVEPGENNLTSESACYFAAGHLPAKVGDFKRRYRSLTATYVTFSPDGKDLLANLGGEQIYLFNIASRRKQMVFDMSGRALEFHFDAKESCDNLKMDCCEEYCSSRKGTNGLTNVVHHSPDCLHSSKNSATPPLQQEENNKRSAVKKLPKEISEMKVCANQAYEQQDYNLAISLLNSAVEKCPNAACLYGNRAAAYIKRAWDGDHYAAIRDCYIALELDSNYLKAHFRLAQCLHKLHWAKEAYDCLQAFRIKFPQYCVTRAFDTFEAEVKMNMFAIMSQLDVKEEENESEEEEEEEEDDDDSSSSSTSGNSVPPLPGVSALNSDISDQEKAWRNASYDYEYRYCGHCNTTTDIKEANFFGNYGEFIVAGSDDGSMFIWDRTSTNIEIVLRADESIVNCLQPHPSTCLLATSGIDPVVRLWSPRAEDGSTDDREILDKDNAAFANQRRMNADPLEIMLLNMGYRLPGVLEQMPEDLENRPGSDRNVVQCRTS